jgi:hypothetical protein
LIAGPQPLSAAEVYGGRADAYSRDYLACSSLAEPISEQSILQRWAAVGTGLGRPAAFQTTFGISVVAFSADFKHSRAGTFHACADSPARVRALLRRKP